MLPLIETLGLTANSAVNRGLATRSQRAGTPMPAIGPTLTGVGWEYSASRRTAGVTTSSGASDRSSAPVIAPPVRVPATASVPA